MNEEEGTGRQLKVCPLPADTGKVLITQIIKHDDEVEFMPAIKCLWCGNS